MSDILPRESYYRPTLARRLQRKANRLERCAANCLIVARLFGLGLLPLSVAVFFAALVLDSAVWLVVTYVLVSLWFLSVFVLPMGALCLLRARGLQRVIRTLEDEHEARYGRAERRVADPWSPG